MKDEPTRRAFLSTVGSCIVSVGGTSILASSQGAYAENRAERPPNIVLILTDDQGYGDVGRHGNEHIRTPNLDRLHDESVRFDRFYVSPVCSPTRSSLMTGRYNYRTGVVDTYLGRSMMHADEVTLAEVLGANGYRTGIFGKWHLGDNYPMRAMDQGFQESLVHRGGGMCQPSDWPGNTYFDPMLSHNGRDEQFTGYCTDVFVGAALAFIQENRDRPFFVYVSTNAPHTPLQVAEEYVAPYRAMGLDEEVAKVYGMVTNIDENVGRLLEKLAALGLDEDTIIIFLTDNGPQALNRVVRFNAGMRGAKGTVYEGGIRVPCFVRWPGHFKAGNVVDRIAAHIDILPTVLDACGVSPPDGLEIDGQSLLPLLRGGSETCPDRTLYFQWHRGDAPELFRACAACGQRYKLVNGKELYDLVEDPGEQHDVASEHTDVVAAMRAGYETWFKDVSGTRGYAPPRIYLGTPHENPVVLTRQDWRAAPGWSDKDVGHWEVHVARDGNYEITLRFPKQREAAKAHLRIGDKTLDGPVDAGEVSRTFRDVALARGDTRVEAWVVKDGEPAGVEFVEVSGP